MINFNIIGQIMGCSGYDIHCHQLANAMFKIPGVNVRLTIPLYQGWETKVNDAELAMIKNQPEPGEINLIITNPLYWRLYTIAERNWVFLVFEGDTVPKCFINECMNPKIEYIFVPSEHTKNALFNTEKTQDEYNSLLNRVKIIPHGVDIALFYPKPALRPDHCIFLANKGFRNLDDRGGIQYLIRAYFEEFNDTDNIGLILKINPAYGIADIGGMIAKLAPRPANLPKIHIITTELAYDKLVDFYNSGTVFVSPTRAEAYNIPCIEAMACGLPVITTDFGGQSDYINLSNGWIVHGELVEVTNGEVMYEGIRWLTPSIAELRRCLRVCYDMPESVKGKGGNALDTAIENTWAKSADKLIGLV